jgi:FeS assembly SUF system regulator
MCTKSVLYPVDTGTGFSCSDLQMIRLGKLTDYGLVLMSEMARQPVTELHTARDLAVKCKLPLPTVSKVLKVLLQSRLLASHRGMKGGYGLVRNPQMISIAEIISALEGPLALTECSMDVTGRCDIEPSCPIRDNQRIINQVVRGALQNVMLADLIRPMQLTAIRNTRGEIVPTSSMGFGRTQ